MPSSLIRFASIAAVLWAAQTTGEAQGFAPRAQPMAPVSQPGFLPGNGQDRMSSVDPDKKLSAGDQVTVEIVEDREGGLPRFVTAAGELDVPPLGRVKVSGKTAGEAAAEIKQLLERDYYHHATVRLAIDRVSQIRSGLVYLSGEVRAVGAQEIIPGEVLTLTNAILKAGGPTEWAAKNKVKLMRQKNGVTVTIEADFKKITETGDAKNDPVLQDGDRIFVPRSFIRF